MDLGLQGKVALVGASSRGLGLAVSQELAAEGANLIMCARGEERLNKARQSIIDNTNVEIVSIAADLSKADEVTELIRLGMNRFGRIDILLTNTGGPPSGVFEELTPEVWQKAVRQNLESVLNLTRAVLPGMKARQWGRIINVTSISVKQPVDNLMLSNSIRAAVTGFARTLANEVAQHNITVNNVLPGYTLTDRVRELAEQISESQAISVEEAINKWESQVPMKRLGKPDEFAALVAFLASERASYITGTSIPVDGGWIRGLF